MDDHGPYIIHYFELYAEREHITDSNCIVARFAEALRNRHQMLVDLTRGGGENTWIERIPEKLLELVLGVGRQSTRCCITNQAV